MFFIGLGTAVPATRYEQREIWEAFRHSAPFAQLAPRSHAILKKVLGGNNGIGSRHLALASLAEVFELTPDALQARFARHAPVLAVDAAQRALADANCQPVEMDAVLISTDHSSYDYQFIVDNSALVVDTRNATKNVKRGRGKVVKA